MSFVNSPIHDLLIRIKNAYMARLINVDWVPFSNFKVQVLTLLKKYKFILDYKVVSITENKKSIDITLNEVVNPVNDIPVIKFYSKPSRRWYKSASELKPVAWGRGIWIISTSQWLMAAHEAKSKNIWGELIAEIY